MADGFETIGWVLKVENKATTQVDKIVSHLEKQVFDVAYDIGNVGKAFKAWGDKQGPVAKGIAGAAAVVAGSFGNVFGSARVEMNDFFVKGFEVAAKGGIKAVTGGLNRSLMGAHNLIEKVGQDMGDFFLLGLDKAQKGSTILKNFFTKERTFGELVKGGAAGLVKITDTVKKLGTNVASMASTARVGLWTKLSGAWTKMFSRKAALEMKESAQDTSFLRRQLDGIERIMEGFKKIGGIAGVILGPFGKILDLFSPFIDMIVEELSPAFETFSDIIKTALGPLSMVMEIIARNLATAIVPFIRPLAAFLELAAVQIGTMIQSLLRGNPEGLVAGIFDVIRKAQPVMMHLLHALMDAGKKVGAALLRAVTKLLPPLLDISIKLLEALIPFIPPLTQIAVEILDKIVLPALLYVANWVDRHMPEITAFIESLADSLQGVADDVTKHWTNFGKMFSDFYVLYIQPIGDWFVSLPNQAAALVRDIGVHLRGLLDILGLDSVGQRLSGVFEALAQAVQSPLQTIKAAINTFIIDPLNTILSFDLPVVGKLSDILPGMGPNFHIPRLAQGGVVEGERGKGIPVIAGEAGREMVLPLRADVIERTLAPLLPDLKFPALDKLLDIAANIEKVLANGTLKVMTMNREQPQANNRGGDLLAAPSMAGGGW